MGLRGRGDRCSRPRARSGRGGHRPALLGHLLPRARAARPGHGAPLAVRPVAGCPHDRRPRGIRREEGADRVRSARARGRGEDLSARAPPGRARLDGEAARDPRALDRARLLRRRARSLLRPVPDPLPGRSCAQHRHAARAAAPAREPRRVASPRGRAARHLRRDGDELARLAEPRRLAARHDRLPPDRVPVRRCRARLGALCRARPGARGPAHRGRRLGRRLRRVREGALAAVPDLASSARPRRGRRGRAGGVRRAPRLPRHHAALVPVPLLGRRRARAGRVARPRPRSPARRALRDSLG